MSGARPSDFDPLRFDIPSLADEEELDLDIIPPGHGKVLWRLIWRISEGDWHIANGHISSHNTLSRAEAKRDEVALWLGQRAAYPLNATSRQSSCGTAQALEDGLRMEPEE
jgi:hypothetical protein